ncbi:MAG: DUF368 domain-containing protein [Clostridia bacterium]|nr:DUF368 domain-containing protein [Clostridia bacterium]
MNFFKGIVIGLGAVAPGLSGSILLVIFGLYRKTIAAISGLFKNFKKNILFLFPLGLGVLCGIFLFSKLVDWLLIEYQMQTRFTFLGLILGSVPLFWREVRKNGFNWKYYIAIIIALSIGFFIFGLNRNFFPPITNPNLFQSILLGFVVATSYIVPGIDSAAVLSALGLYDLWVSSLANLNFAVLIPAAVGVLLGVLIISFIINKLISKCYTLTFSVIFGLFISVIPSVLNESCVIEFNAKTYISFVLLILGFLGSLAFSNWEKILKKVKQLKNKSHPI